jgi:hypothetical protein
MSAAALQAEMAALLRRRRDLGRDAEALRFAAEHLGGNERLTGVEQLEIYREQFYLRHTASLVEDFPGVGGILGQEDWDRLVWDYLERVPPTSFDLGDLGAGLADFIEACVWLDHRDLVADMARLEYSHMEVFDAPDAARLDPAKLGAVPEDAWEHARLVPDPGLRVLKLGYPVTALRRQIVVQQADADAPAIALPAPEKNFFAVHRRERAIFHDRLEPRAHALLSAIVGGEPLGLACASAARALDITVEALAADLEHWFADWSARGYLVDVIVASEANHPA